MELGSDRGQLACMLSLVMRQELYDFMDYKGRKRLYT